MHVASLGTHFLPGAQCQLYVVLGVQVAFSSTHLSSWSAQSSSFLVGVAVDFWVGVLVAVGAVISSHLQQFLPSYGAIQEALVAIVEQTMSAQIPDPCACLQDPAALLLISAICGDRAM